MLSLPIMALIAENVAQAQASDPEIDGMAMEMIEQYGFNVAPEFLQPNEDPAMLDVVYTADGRTIFNMMCVLGYRRNPARSTPPL